MSNSPYGLIDFAEEVRSTYSLTKPETFWNCGPAVKRLISSSAIASWFNEQLTALRADPLHLGDWSAKEVVLHRGTGWAVSVALFDTPRRYIHALPFYAFYAPLSGALAVARYALPKGFRNDVFDPSLRLESSDVVSVPAGDVLELHTDQWAYDFHIGQATPVFRFATSPNRSLEWLFSKSTLQAWQANDAAVAFTQLRVAAYVLGKISHHSSIGPLQQLSRHPHHAVRWAAIQNLGRLSRSEALVKIREAVNDPHPHVRRAAQKTLDALSRGGSR